MSRELQFFNQDSFLRPFLEDFFQTPTGTVFQNRFPETNVEETDEYYLINFNIPGIPKEEVKIGIEGKRLTVSGEHKAVTKNGRSYGTFSKAYTLPDGVDWDKVEAHHEDGVLRVVLPKAEYVKPKEIPIATEKKGFFQKLLN